MSKKKEDDAQRKRLIRLVLVLVTVILGSVFYRNYYNPKLRRIRFLSQQEMDLDMKADNIRNESPNIDQARREIEAMRENYQGHIETLKNLERNIPRSAALDQFLHYLTLKDFSRNIQFQSIKPVAPQGGQAPGRESAEEDRSATGYQVHHYEIQVTGPYPDTLTYFYYLDQLSRYATVTRLTFSSEAESLQGQLGANARFSILISDEPSRKEEAESFEVRIDRSTPVSGASPFFTPVSPPKKETLSGEEIKGPPPIPVSGVLSVGTEYRIIVNERILKAGDAVGDAVITRIEKSKMTVQFQNKAFEIPIP